MLKIEYDKPLAALTTFHLRANAEAWVEVASLEDIRDALSVAKGRGWQTTILGGGSNVVPDAVGAGPCHPSGISRNP